MEPDEEPAKYTIDWVGSDRIVFSTDYPHGDSKYPDAVSSFFNLGITDEEKRKMLEDDRTAVNTFRLVFNSYFGSNYEMLEDKMYWGWNAKPYYFEEVTSYLLEK